MLYINAHINDFEPSQGEIADSRKRIKFRCDLAGSTMVDVLSGRGWTQVDEDDDSWHLYWSDVNKTAEILDSRQFEPYQKIPHFRNHFELTRKNLLAKNLKHYKRYLKRHKCNREVMVEIMPRTYEIPSEYSKFLADFDKSLGITWILKPASGRQGSGIFLFQDLKDLDDWRADLINQDDFPKRQKSTHRLKQRPDTIELPGVYVVQKYIERPYLIDGKKFDIRFYVLVTSWRPLTVWLSRDGFARICGNKYSLENLRSSRVHLTNMAIQLRPCSTVDSMPGTKWRMQKLKSYLEAEHGEQTTAEVMERISTLVMTSIRSVARVIRPDIHCFELYGYDVLLDEKLKPWLLEVNASPSLHATGPDDYRMKFDLLTDVVNIIDFENVFTGFESRIGGFDLIWKDGPVLTLRDAVGTAGDYDKVVGKAGAFSVTDPNYPDRLLNGHLGEPNDRLAQLAILKFQRQVAKVIANLPSEPLWAPADQPCELPAELPTELKPLPSLAECNEVGEYDTGGDDIANYVNVVDDIAKYGAEDFQIGKDVARDEIIVEKVTGGKTVSRKKSTEKVKGESLIVDKVILGKSPWNKINTNKKIALEAVTTRKVTGKKVTSEKPTWKKVTSEKVADNTPARDKEAVKNLTNEKVAVKKLSIEKGDGSKLTRQKVAVSEGTKATEMVLRDPAGDTSDTGSESSDNTEVESSSESSAKSSPRKGSGNSSAVIDRKVFGLGGLGALGARIA